MLILSNGIRILLDHVAWYSLRYQKADDRPQGLTHNPSREKWVLQFGYAGGEKTFVAYTDKTEGENALARADAAMNRWIQDA